LNICYNIITTTEKHLIMNTLKVRIGFSKNVILLVFTQKGTAIGLLYSKLKLNILLG